MNLTAVCSPVERALIECYRGQDWMKAAARLAVWRVKDFTQW